ncbi:MAG TPA: protein kinase [Thermoanaerobaculia bacterium]|jgi:serine/threonine-protein kinase
MVCLRCKHELDPSSRSCPHCGEPVTEFARKYSSELLDGKYQIVERLGAGGMGEVYKAVHTYLGSTRVIKVVHPNISGSSDAHERFLREARAATKVQHPNVATMHDFSALPDGSHYMVWEFIDGQNVAQRLRERGTLPPHQAVNIAIQALHGLEAIHRAGIIHRDISPENLMITRDDEVKIIDLGVAKVEDSASTSATQTGIFVGKLRYAAPEQLGFLDEGEKIDGRTDIYALGMVLFELLTGRPPYEAKSPHEYFLLHAREQMVRTVELPINLPGGQALSAAIEKSLARNRNERWSSAREFAHALEEIDRSLPRPNDMPTMAIALDGDETVRPGSRGGFGATTPDTLHRETVRTANDATAARPRANDATIARPPAYDPTVARPMPQQQPLAEPTVRTPFPEPPVAAAQQPRLTPGMNPIWIVLVLVLLVVGAGIAAVMLWPRRGTEAATTETTTTTASAPLQQTQTGTPQRAETTVDVTDTATPVILPETTTTAATQTTAPPQVATATTAPPPAETPRPREPRPAPAEPREDDTPAPAPSYSGGGGEVYVDGGGDPDGNERALARLKREMRGVSAVEVHAPGMQGLLVNALNEAIPSLNVLDHAEVVIQFDGVMERLGRGRKRRAASAIITKRGRVVFRYQLPDEIYRVGSNPQEAFASVLSDAFTE